MGGRLGALNTLHLVQNTVSHYTPALLMHTFMQYCLHLDDILSGICCCLGCTV